MRALLPPAHCNSRSPPCSLPNAETGCMVRRVGVALAIQLHGFAAQQVLCLLGALHEPAHAPCRALQPATPLTPWMAGLRAQARSRAGAEQPPARGRAGEAHPGCRAPHARGRAGAARRRGAAAGDPAGRGGRARAPRRRREAQDREGPAGARAAGAAGAALLISRCLLQRAERGCAAEACALSGGSCGQGR